MLPVRAGPFEITGGGVSLPPKNKSYALEKIPADKRALKKKKFMYQKFFTPTPVISNGRPQTNQAIKRAITQGIVYHAVVCLLFSGCLILLLFFLI